VLPKGSVKFWGRFFAGYAKKDRPWTQHIIAYTWAEIVLMFLDHFQHLREESLSLLQAHALAYTSAASLKDHRLQCQVIRTWNGQMTNLKLCLSPEFQVVGTALTRILVPEQ
jgi:hypothetical protein